MSSTPSASRQAVEKLLRDNPGRVYTCAQLVALTGLQHAQVQQHLSNATKSGAVINTTPPPGLGHYRWRMTAAQPSPVAAHRCAHGAGHYDGRELQPYAGRPGAMRAFSLPSLVNGVATARVAPRCMTSALPAGRRA